MAVIRLYRRFYCINSNENGDDYNLIDPISLKATSLLKNTSNLIETVSIIQKESKGIYFVDLNPNLYSYENIYDLKWTVQYTENTGNKNLFTTFKLKPISISSEMNFDLNNQEELSYEINNTKTIESSIDESNDFELDETMNAKISEILEVEILK